MSITTPRTSRRTVIRTTLWTAPAVSVVATAPAWAASTGASVAMARRTPTTASARAFDPGQAQGVSVVVTDPLNGSPVVGRAVTFTLATPAPTWLRLVDSAGVAVTSVVVASDARGVATAPVLVVGVAAGTTADVVASLSDPSGTVSPVSWSFAQAARGLSPSGPVGTAGRFTGAYADGRAFTWGTQTEGQLGVGSSASIAYLPAAVSATAPSTLAGRDVLSLAAGDEHMLALTADGTVHGWGRSTYGQLGNGTTTSNLVPGAVSTAQGSSLAGRTVTAIAVGAFFSLALASDGTVHAWGRNSDSQLGDGTTDSRSLPVQVGTMVGSSLEGRRIVAIAAGNGHSIALDAEGNLHSWGRNASGILGQGTVGGVRAVPALVSSTTGTQAGVTAVAAGANYTLALAVDGTVHAWGTNAQGQLGSSATLGGALSVPTPVATTGSSSLAGKSVVAIAGGQQHALAVASDGTLHSWGANGASQLGWGGTTNQGLPGAVATGSPSSLAGRTIVAASGMRSTSFALAADGTFHSWGSDANGERADGDGVSSGATPTQVVGIG